MVYLVIYRAYGNRALELLPIVPVDQFWLHSLKAVKLVHVDCMDVYVYVVGCHEYLLKIILINIIVVIF